MPGYNPWVPVDSQEERLQAYLAKALLHSFRVRLAQPQTGKGIDFRPQSKCCGGGSFIVVLSELCVLWWWLICSTVRHYGGGSFAVSLVGLW
jgi:hypothetical protein